MLVVNQKILILKGGNMKKKFIYILTGIALTTMFCPVVKHAQAYSIKNMTKEVQAALDARRARYDTLKSFKKQGIVGENNKGYVQVLESNAEASKLVDQENKDRKVIYQTIAEQNNLQGQSEAIEGVFAQVQNDKAESGEMVQKSDGTWVKK